MVALSVAILLGVALIYTSFSASTDVKKPSQLIGTAPGTKAEMDGEVVPGSIRHHGASIDFRVVDSGGKGQSLPVSYTGTIPDPFRGGREIVLSGAMDNGTLVGEPETLTTKCPSKFTTNSNS